MKENGELEKLIKKWWYESSECPGGDLQDISREELSLNNVAGIFYILIAGLLIAMVVALVEFCYKSHIESSRVKVFF